jgi:hypothetical protein
MLKALPTRSLIHRLSNRGEARFNMRTRGSQTSFDTQISSRCKRRRTCEPHFVFNISGQEKAKNHLRLETPDMLLFLLLA